MHCLACKQPLNKNLISATLSFTVGTARTLKKELRPLMKSHQLCAPCAKRFSRILAAPVAIPDRSMTIECPPSLREHLGKILSLLNPELLDNAYIQLSSPLRYVAKIVITQVKLAGVPTSVTAYSYDLNNATLTSLPVKKPTLSHKLLKLAGTAEGLPPDLAVNHDHYLYGGSRKQRKETHREPAKVD